ncbi:hypothetical protein H6G41_24185 [Tolypothrix sp. FACHB-123]|uniref:hypothetical protein n=1 Tax=Tolypothrix sp. FACHB-123 TaxID=2692868 RepID=UPI00199EC751|nr:hypothetical protein [Tolypothrix sp. FACHB-123]MBD2357672.1 hypothetical protein [Tolypothrix sp. FACHB-123]
MSEMSNISSERNLLPPNSDLEANQTTPVEVISSSELTTEEWSDRIFLERQVERAFYIAAKALKALRDRRLYRSTHSTFEDYCRSRFGFTHRHVNYLIAGSFVVDNLMGTNGSQIENSDEMGTIGSQIGNPDEMGTNGSQIKNSNETGTDGSQIGNSDEMGTIGSQILPTSERQVRPLVPLKPEQQRQAWQQAVELAGGKIPSGRIVQDIVDKIRERTKLPNPYRLGEVCTLLPKDNPELKGKSGCWGVITHVGDYSCTLETWDAEYTVKIEHLKSLELLDNDCQFMQQLCARLRRLHEIENRDIAVDWLGLGLGKQPKPYLSPLQEKLLADVEQEYGLH